MCRQRVTTLRLKCPCCRTRLRESADMWGPVYVCDRCGYATDEDALNQALDVDLRRLLAHAAGTSQAAIEGEDFGPR